MLKQAKLCSGIHSNTRSGIHNSTPPQFVCPTAVVTVFVSVMMCSAKSDYRVCSSLLYHCYDICMYIMTVYT
jgi:hypothetical protein